jgi:NhaP-type Na+/H+ or K+/H+ antiporter
MENYTIILLFMALMIGASGIAEKIKIPAPVLLLLTGIPWVLYLRSRELN